MTAWDIYQHMQIRGVRMQVLSSEADRVRQDHRVGGEVEELNARVDRLALLVQAFWQVARELDGFSEERLVAELEALVNARAEPEEPLTCAECSSKVAAGLDRCTYCGAAVPIPFDPFRL
jgi:hypothetical protein